LENKGKRWKIETHVGLCMYVCTNQMSRLRLTQNLVAYRCSISSCIANLTEVMKHDRTQTSIAHDRFDSLNKHVHAAKVITNSPIYINEVLRSQVVHRKISTLTFGTNLDLSWRAVFSCSFMRLNNITGLSASRMIPPQLIANLLCLPLSNILSIKVLI
jgi:hypothetical protein